MSQYSSYYLYQKYIKIGEQDWIPCYPNTYSISGDSANTMPLVEKSSADTACGYVPSAEYRWVDLPISTNWICDECPSPPPTTAVTAVTLNTGSTNIEVGNTYQLTATVLPSDASDKSVTWSTSNSGVATVSSSGLVTAVSSGSCTITVTTNDGGYTATCSVSVTSTPTPPTPTSGDYLTFVALESGTFSFTPKNNNVISYSLDSGNTWVTDTAVTVNAGDVVKWKGNMTSYTIYPNNGIGTFSATSRFSAEGNPMSLLFGDDFEDKTSLSGKDGAFYNLFYDNAKLVSAENLCLPATTLAQYCYNGMFYACTSLTTAPELPATTLSQYCYYNMFASCASLTTAPQLPATTLADYCYAYMFNGCSSLTTVPTVLPATTLTNYCYQYMFASCTSLTTAPELPATTLTNYCYNDMFRDCTSLQTAPELPATTLAYNCYSYMFYNCSGLTTAPELLATTLASSCYRYMFAGCTNLNYIKCMATDISATTCTYKWVNGVQTNSGTFVKAASMTSWGTGDDGIPNGWTVQNA